MKILLLFYFLSLSLLTSCKPAAEQKVSYSQLKDVYQPDKSDQQAQLSEALSQKVGVRTFLFEDYQQSYLRVLKVTTYLKETVNKKPIRTLYIFANDHTENSFKEQDIYLNMRRLTTLDDIKRVFTELAYQINEIKISEQLNKEMGQDLTARIGVPVYLYENFRDSYRRMKASASQIKTALEGKKVKRLYVFANDYTENRYKEQEIFLNMKKLKDASSLVSTMSKLAQAIFQIQTDEASRAELSERLSLQIGVGTHLFENFSSSYNLVAEHAAELNRSIAGKDVNSFFIFSNENTTHRSSNRDIYINMSMINSGEELVSIVNKLADQVLAGKPARAKNRKYNEELSELLGITTYFIEDFEAAYQKLKPHVAALKEALKYTDVKMIFVVHKAGAETRLNESKDLFINVGSNKAVTEIIENLKLLLLK